ncbi:DUF2236 domain-containing protein [Skermania piniformis]|uniref:DUF2236 domain-containing protein n=2 Tax=Skermania pinensis TaxID=39122 RepID=A0ABX8SJY7_9ACTN|nr:DUF2236 domain-containing protein [Skermania piniformis]
MPAVRANTDRRRLDGGAGAFDIRDYLDNRAILFAGTANSIMQLSWPEIGYGVYESKVTSGSIMYHPWKRLRTTTTYLAVALLGTESERAAYRQAVNGQHRQVRSGPDSPVAYNAFSRDLQLWVAACLYYGTVDVNERMHGPIPAAHREPLYRYCARLGTTLQMRPDQWPADTAAFARYWQDGLERVSIDDTIRDYFHRLMNREFLPSWQRTGRRQARTLTIGFLPPEFRAALQVEWSDSDQQHFDTVLAKAGARARREPRAVRNAAFTAALTDLRARRLLRRPLV